MARPALRAVPSADGAFGPVAPDKRHITAVTTPALTLATMSKTTKVMVGGTGREQLRSLYPAA